MHIHGRKWHPFNMKWMILPSLLNSVLLIALITGAFELICSQSPYTMRGLLFGAMYGCVMLYGVIGYGVSKPFTKHVTQNRFGVQES